MKYSIRVAQMFATARTLIADAAVVAFDMCFFRRRLKKRAQFWEAQTDQFCFMWKKAEAKLEALEKVVSDMKGRR